MTIPNTTSETAATAALADAEEPFVSSLSSDEQRQPLSQASPLRLPAPAQQSTTPSLEKSSIQWFPASL